MQCLGLLLALFSLSNAFHLDSYLLGQRPYRLAEPPRSPIYNWGLPYDLDTKVQDERLKVTDEDKTADVVHKEKKAGYMKRFRPCYYSPIQCLIKRR